MVAIAGAVFLKEKLYGKQLVAGGTSDAAFGGEISISFVSAISFCGVILIARPEFLFGGLDDLPPLEAKDRLVAVA